MEYKDYKRIIPNLKVESDLNLKVKVDPPF